MFTHCSKKALLSLVTALFLASCGGEDAEHAQKAAEWLEDTAGLRDLPTGWKLDKVTALDSNDVEMAVTVTTQRQENAIRAIPQMKRFIAVQVACPKKDDEVWTLFDNNRKLWLNVTGVSGKRLTRGSCWH